MVCEKEKNGSPLVLSGFFVLKGEGFSGLLSPKPKEGAAFFGFRGWRLRWFFL
jgi:hypothetical protein